MDLRFCLFGNHFYSSKSSVFVKTSLGSKILKWFDINCSKTKLLFCIHVMNFNLLSQNMDHKWEFR